MPCSTCQLHFKLTNEYRLIKAFQIIVDPLSLVWLVILLLKKPEHRKSLYIKPQSVLTYQRKGIISVFRSMVGVCWFF